MDRGRVNSSKSSMYKRLSPQNSRHGNTCDEDVATVVPSRVATTKPRYQVEKLTRIYFDDLIYLSAVLSGPR